MSSFTNFLNLFKWDTTSQEDLQEDFDIDTTLNDNWNKIDAKVQEINSKIYPVGSIYMSVNNTNPSTIFGGTWEQIKDTFLLSAGDTYTAGDTGGEAEHKLLSKELPGGTAKLDGGNGSSMQYASTTSGTVASSRPVVSALSQFGSTYGQAHNNMPPYLVVYMWKRVS